jgi:type II secretory pathway component PulF
MKNFSILNFQFSIFKRVSFVDRLLFTKHLSIMLKSGITLSEGIHIIHDQTVKPYFRSVLAAIEADVANGQSLTKALSKHPKVFNSVYLSLIKIGEESGALEKNLEYLADQQKKSDEFNKSVRGAMMYPAIVLSAAVIVGGGVSLFVLPQLADLFKSLDVKLPITTQILLFIADFMKKYNILVFIGLVVFVTSGRFLISLKVVRPHWDAFLLSLPKIGLFLQQIQLATFCRNLGIMLQSGLPITTALQTLHDSTTNVVYKDLVAKISVSVDKGRSLEEALDRLHSRFLPLIVVRMIGVGEKSGKLEDTFLYLGEFFEDEVDNTAKNLSVILEPIILLGIGLIVAFVVFSIISPIYDLTSSIKSH